MYYTLNANIFILIKEKICLYLNYFINTFIIDQPLRPTIKNCHSNELWFLKIYKYVYKVILLCFYFYFFIILIPKVKSSVDLPIYHHPVQLILLLDALSYQLLLVVEVHIVTIKRSSKASRRADAHGKQVFLQLWHKQNVFDSTVDLLTTNPLLHDYCRHRAE